MGIFIRLFREIRSIPGGKIEWVTDSSALIKVLQRSSESPSSLLKVGNGYRLSDITAERDRLDLVLKTRGYYYFNPDYLMVYADSTDGERKVNLILNIKKATPDDARHAYQIRDIFVYPNYSLESAKVDTVKNDFTFYDSLKIKTNPRFDKSLFGRMITYRPGRYYSSKQQNTTLNRLINLPAFKFVKNRFEPSRDSIRKDSSHFLNAYYYLTPAKRNSIQAELDAFTKENNFFGTQVSLNYRTRNAFREAEQLGVKVYGAIETTSGAAVKNNNFRLGTEITLKVPKYVTPFFRIKENFFYPPNTNFLLGYEYLRKDIYYTKNLFRFSLDATWKPNVQQQYTVSPIALSYLQASSITDSFRKEALLNPSLNYTVYSETVLGSYASYTYNSNFRSKKNKVYFNAGIDLSGNLAGLFTGSKSYRSKSVFGVPFAQYVKIDVDYHYTRRLTNGYDWANRLLVGIGIPYNNSRILPLTKLYTIGGSNSIRGFRSRTLGPGSYKPTPKDQRFFQVIGGDYKLLANTELRVPFSKTLSGAIFLDVGNIWTKDTVLFGPQGKFTKNFLKELAVATGLGIRFDAVVLLIRADLGTPLRKPYLPDSKRWVFNNFNFGSAAWRRENLILNIAIGLPF